MIVCGKTPAGAALFPALLNSPEPKIELLYENTRRVCYDETTRRVTDEAFLLEYEEEPAGCRVRAICSGEKSAFYALSELDRRLRENTLPQCQGAYAPRFEVRGYIEGFYGTPWRQEDRLCVLRTMARYRMNTVFYAPKDDPYHRERWKEPYPEAALSRLKALVEAAGTCHMRFVWCVAPGLSIRYADPEDFRLLTEKIRRLHELGVRDFGLLLDDIGETLKDPSDRAVYGELVNAQIDLVHRLGAALKNMDPGVTLTVCPTVYHGRGDEYYIAKLGRELLPEVSVFWTGRDICSRELTGRDALLFFEHTRKKPLYWDNYPVNDMAMRREMHLGPLLNREGDLWRYAKGLVMNCMEYAACSLIPLRTAADYLWLGERYEPERAWEAAVRDAVGAENASAFLTFAEHLRVSCLQDENSPLLKALFGAMGRAICEGDPDYARRLAAEYLEKTEAAAAFLQRDLPLCRELRPWAEKFELFRETLPLVFREMAQPDPARRETLAAMLEAYARNPWRFAEEMDLIEAADGAYTQ